MRGVSKMKVGAGVLMGIVIMFWGGMESRAANISDFLKVSPFAEVEIRYDDNVFELAEDAPLPENGTEREDISIHPRAGLGLDLELERPYLTLGIGLDYTFEYSKYMDNDDLDASQNKLNFELKFASNYEQGLLKDRLKFNINDVLSLIPIDEEEPLFDGNQTMRNVFTVGADYALLSTPRFSTTIGYAYTRTDYQEDDPIEVVTVQNYAESSDLTQESELHSGKAEVKYELNSKLIGMVTYTYGYNTREENAGELYSASFTRQNVMGGIQAKFSSRVHGNLQGGYTTTTYDDVEGVEQDDQSSFVAETSITANFAHQPLMTVGYRKYFTENDFGDTLLTDNVFARVGFKIAQGFMVNLTGDYILEDRDLFDDEAVQKIFGVESEYELVKNMSVLARYNYRNKEFFVRNFLSSDEREETTSAFSGGLRYKFGRRFLVNGLYTYTDKTSNIAEQAFSRNQFIVSGKVIF